MDRLMDVWINGILSTGILEESPDYIWLFAFFPYTGGNWGKSRKSMKRQTTGWTAEGKG